ncbi:MAG: hypothetical protein V7K35_19690 [Nostoc sp.]|uniref:hypothetical protein n=1 Tax=Nostoc sp. TaxID=1180 RepID=UPI002FFCD5AB
MRSLRVEFTLSLGFTYEDGQTFLFDNLATPFGIGPDANGVSRTSIIKFGQVIDLSDRGNNAQDDGLYFSLRYQLSKVVR